MVYEWRSREVPNKSPIHNKGKEHQLFAIKVDGDVSVASLLLSYQKEGRYWVLRVVGVSSEIGSVQLYKSNYRYKHQAEYNGNKIAKHHATLVKVAAILNEMKDNGGCTWE